MSRAYLGKRHPTAAPWGTLSVALAAVVVLCATAPALSQQSSSAPVGRLEGVQHSAAPPCGPRAVIVPQLERDFGEVLVGAGLASNGTVLELLVSAERTWTMLITLPNGNSCFGAAGERWTEILLVDDEPATEGPR